MALFSSSIDTGLSATPDLSNLNDPQKLTFQLIQLYNAIFILQQAIDSYTGNTPNAIAQYDGTNPGSAILIQSQTRAYYIVDTAIGAGKLVTILSTKKVKHADIGSPTTLARGIATAAFAVGAVAEIVLLGSVAIYATGTFTPGQVYYCGSNGAFLATPSAVSGTVNQAIGYALSDTDFWFYPQILSTVVP